MFKGVLRCFLWQTSESVFFRRKGSATHECGALFYCPKFEIFEGAGDVFLHSAGSFTELKNDEFCVHGC